MSKILLINGPNMNLLGVREPEIYGSTTLQDIEKQLTDFLNRENMQLVCFQSNHEGEIIDFLQQQLNAAGIIINPGGLTHNSVVLRDALTARKIPFIEVHISNIYGREEFRKHSVLSDVARGVICGLGVVGYQLAAEGLLKLIKKV